MVAFKGERILTLPVHVALIAELEGNFWVVLKVLEIYLPRMASIGLNFLPIASSSCHFTLVLMEFNAQSQVQCHASD